MGVDQSAERRPGARIEGFRTACLAFLCCLAAAPALAQKESADQLAKQLSNPVASLISVPFQNNFNFKAGPHQSGFIYIDNIQPVVPISLNADWNLIVRTILPNVFKENAPQGREFGFGDTTQSFFLSPSSGKIIWGVGPAFLWPTATSDTLGSQKWGVGPTFVVLTQEGPWTVGMLANHIWSYAGPGGTRGDVNATFAQPFVAYALGQGWTLSANSQTTYDWTNDKLTVPVLAAVSKVFKVGSQAMSLQFGAQYYAIRPEGSPVWGLQATLTLLFPK